MLPSGDCRGLQALRRLRLARRGALDRCRGAHRQGRVRGARRGPKGRGHHDGDLHQVIRRRGWLRRV